MRFTYVYVTCLLLNALKMEKWVRKSTLSSRSDSIPMGSWSIMMLGMLGGMLSQTAWATKEPYTEEASKSTTDLSCKCSEANGKAHLIEYVFQNVKQSKTPLHFGFRVSLCRKIIVRAVLNCMVMAHKTFKLLEPVGWPYGGADGPKRVEGSYGKMVTK